jgi:hypothetical protein
MFIQELIQNDYQHPHHLLSQLVLHYSKFLPADLPPDLEDPPTCPLLIRSSDELFNCDGFDRLDEHDPTLQFIYRCICYRLLDYGDMIQSAPRALKQTAFARVLEGGFARINEPLAFLRLARYLEKRFPSLDLAAYLAGRMQDPSSRPFAFEEILAIYLGSALANGSPLDRVFEFRGARPSWASKRGRVVACVKGKEPSADIYVPYPFKSSENTPHPLLGFRSSNRDETQDWFSDPRGRTFLFPDKLCGPDCVALAELEGGERVYIILQMKFHRHVGSLPSFEVAKAIQSTTPTDFYQVCIRSHALPSVLSIFFRPTHTRHRQ